MPRRMRRKMRGGGSMEARPRSQHRGEAAPPRVVKPSRRAGPSSAPSSERYSRPEKAPLPSITELLKEGQEIIVQIAKEPLGQKGARITSHIALPGRYVVYMPTLEHTGVSRKIASDEERLRLKRILQIHAAGIPGGFIVRTAGEGKSEEDLAADMNFPFQPLAGHPPEGGKEARAAAAASRSRHRAAHAARPVHRGLQSHLGG